MRQFFTVTLAAILLAGCGAQGNVAGTYASPSNRAALMGAKSQAPLLQVLNHERALQESVQKTFSAWAMPQQLSFPMEPDQKVRMALSVHAGAAATRSLPGGEREVIGWATFVAGRAHSFEHFHALRAFRMVLKADGTLKEARLDGPTLDDSQVVKPAFAPVASADAAPLKRRLEGFLQAPAQASWLKTFLWTAIAGKPTTHTYELHEVRSTAGNFGAFGRITRFRGTLSRDGKPMPGYTNFEIEVVLDRQGQVIAAGDPTRW